MIMHVLGVKWSVVTKQPISQTHTFLEHLEVFKAIVKNHVPKELCVHYVLRIRLSTRITIQMPLFFAFQKTFQKPDFERALR